MNIFEKFDYIIEYLYLCETRYENQVIIKKNILDKSKTADPYAMLEYYKAKCKYDACKEISRDLELIVFDNYKK